MNDELIKAMNAVVYYWGITRVSQSSTPITELWLLIAKMQAAQSAAMNAIADVLECKSGTLQ